MEPSREGSPFNACSTLLSMDCQIMDQQSASKAATSGGQGGGLQQANLNKSNSTSSNNHIDDQFGKEEQVEENAQNSSMLQGSMIFDMLSAMQFNAHSTIHEQAHINNNSLLNMSTPLATSQKAANLISGNNNNIISPEGSPPWHLHLYNNHARADPAYIQPHTMDNSMQHSAAPSNISTFDPIASFLKLPVLADQTQLGLASDQRLTNSTYLNSSHKDQDPLYNIGPAAQAYNSVASNNNWFSSLQLESIRDCSNDNNVVQHLDHHHHHHHHLEGASELEAKLLMKLNGEETTISSHDNIGSHEERLMLNESYNSTSMHMLHNEEQLLYTLNNEGGDNIINEGGHGSGMLENMHMMQMMGYSNDPNANSEFGGAAKGISRCSSIMGATGKTTRKRGVRGSGKNSEDRENQRMTHIAVERNRRRQMNDHLRVLRALMPPSYIQRGDQASIIGGAIEFVRELEQLLQCLESQKRRRIMVSPVNAPVPQPGAFQPCLVNTQAATGYGAPSSTDHHHLQHQLQAGPYMQDEGGLQNLQEEVAQAKSAVADIEVKVVEKSEALIKILSQRRPRQLLLTIQALQEHLHLSILHTNVTTIDNTVLYSFTVKIHHDCDYSANHIATLVHEIFIDIIEQKRIKDM